MVTGTFEKPDTLSQKPRRHQGQYSPLSMDGNCALVCAENFVPLAGTAVDPHGPPSG